MNFEVFPDYCSTGLWDADTGWSIDADSICDELDLFAQGLFAGLYQWNWVWEMSEDTFSDTGLALWKEAGAKLVVALNMHYAGQHTFVYRTDLL
jgi:hypothetical protein